MLSGRYNFNINEKGRLFVPSKMRDSLGEKFILSRSATDKCLVIYPTERWNTILDELMKNATATKAVRRKLFGNAVEMEADKQGRIIVPLELREFADLTGEVVIVGIGDSAEVWNAEAYEQKENAQDDEQSEKLLIELGL